MPWRVVQLQNRQNTVCSLLTNGALTHALLEHVLTPRQQILDVYAVEKHLGRKLFYLACRHHVHELVLREVWEMPFGKDQGPTYTPFQKLQSTWDKLDMTSKTSFSILPVNGATMQDQRKKMCRLLMDIVTGHAEKVSLPRDDYKELIELSLIVLGEKPPAGLSRI
jgi:hypothetical protein